MEINAETRIPFPRAAVFACYRDKMAELLPMLESVRKIEVKSREEEGPMVRLVNEWTGGGDVPAAARAVVGDAMMTWTDYADWDSSKYTCAWRLKTHAFTEAVTCHGENTFTEEDGKTRIVMKGLIEIDGKKIKGVPGFLAGKVSRTVEDFLRSKVQPNFVEVTNAIAKHLGKGA